MKKISFFMSLLVAALLLSSCTHRLTDFTIISTRNVPVGVNAKSLVKAKTRVKGSESAPIVLLFPFGSPNMKDAIDDALDKYKGAVALADGVIKTRFLWFIFGGANSIIVEGTPLYEVDSK